MRPNITELPYLLTGDVAITEPSRLLPAPAEKVSQRSLLDFLPEKWAKTFEKEMEALKGDLFSPNNLLSIFESRLINSIEHLDSNWNDLKDSERLQRSYELTLFGSMYGRLPRHNPLGLKVVDNPGFGRINTIFSKKERPYGGETDL